MQVEWNDQAALYLTAAQRHAIESGEEPNQLEGTVRTDSIGNVWLTAGETKKLIGIDLGVDIGSAHHEPDLTAPEHVPGHAAFDHSDHE